MAKATTYMVQGHPVEFRQGHIETRIPVGENDMSVEDERRTAATVEWYESAAGFVSYNLKYRDFTQILCDINGGLDGSRYYLEKVTRWRWLDRKTCEGYEVWKPLSARQYDRSPEWYESNGVVELDEDGVRELKMACVTEGRKFVRRLKAYLKRYGTSKLHVWTYWTEA